MKSRLDAGAFERAGDRSGIYDTPKAGIRQSRKSVEYSNNSKHSSPITAQSQGVYTFANPTKRSTTYESPERTNASMHENSYVSTNSYSKDISNPYRKGNLASQERSGYLPAVYQDNGKYLEREDRTSDMGTETRTFAKDLEMTKKSLNESQAQCVALAKELGRTKQENSGLQIQIKRLDLKCKELVDKGMEFESENKELLYANSQLKSEVVRLKAELQENSMKTRNDLERLRNNLYHVEKTLDQRSSQILSNSQKQRALLNSLQKVLMNTDFDLYQRLSQTLDNLLKISDETFDAIHTKHSDIVPVVGKENSGAGAVQNEYVSRLEAEKAGLAERVVALENQLLGQKNKHEEAVAQYRDAVNKLKNSTNTMKGCIAQLQDLRVKEKKESEEKIEALDKQLKKSEEEVKRVKKLNKELSKQVEEYESTLKENEGQLLKILQENKEIYQKLQSFEESIKTREKSSQNFYKASESHSRQLRFSPQRQTLNTSPDPQPFNLSTQSKQVHFDLQHSTESPDKSHNTTTNYSLQPSNNPHSPTKVLREKHENNQLTDSAQLNRTNSDSIHKRAYSSFQNSLNTSFDPMSNSKSDFRRTDGLFDRNKASYEKKSLNRRSSSLSRSQIVLNHIASYEKENAQRIHTSPNNENDQRRKVDVSAFEDKPKLKSSMRKTLSNLNRTAPEGTLDEGDSSAVGDAKLKQDILSLDYEIARIQRSLENEISRHNA